MKFESIRDYSYSLLFIVFGLIHLVKILFLFAKFKYSFSLLNIWFFLRFLVEDKSLSKVYSADIV